MKPVIATLFTVSMFLPGCRNGGAVDADSVSDPVPGVETHAHGYETEDGTAVKYADVDTGDKSSGGGGGGYDDRAVAK